MLLRVGKRSSSWETDDAAAVCDVEFRAKDGSTELEVSVYALAGVEQLVQACAEHAANIPLDPKATVNADLEGLTPAPVEVPGGGRFAFTSGAHRNIVFETRDALLQTLTQVLADRGRRLHRVERAQVRDYVRARREAGDREWVEFLNTCSDSWRKLVGPAAPAP